MDQEEQDQGGAEYQDPRQNRPEMQNQSPRRSGPPSGQHVQADHPYRRSEDTEGSTVPRRPMKIIGDVTLGEHRLCPASRSPVQVTPRDDPVEHSLPSTSGKPLEGFKCLLETIKVLTGETDFPDLSARPPEDHRQEQPAPEHSTGAIPKRKHISTQTDELTQPLPGPSGLEPPIQVKEISVMSSRQTESPTESPLHKRYKFRLKETAEVAQELDTLDLRELTLSEEIKTSADIPGVKTDFCREERSSSGIERRIKYSERNRGFALDSENTCMRWTTTHVIIYSPNALAPNFKLTPNDNPEKWALHPLKKPQYREDTASGSKQEIQVDVSADTGSDEEMLGRPSPKGTSNRVYGLVPHLGNITNSCVMHEPSDYCNLFTTCRSCGTPQELFARVPMHLVVQWSKKIGTKSHTFRKEYEVLFPVDPKVMAVMLKAERPDVKEWLINSKAVNFNKIIRAGRKKVPPREQIGDKTTSR